MGACFPAVELDNVIQFSTLSRMSGFLWYSSKWARRFGRFLQYAPGLELLTRSLNTNLNYVDLSYTPIAPFLEPPRKVVSTFRGKMWQLLGCILIDRYITKQHSLLGPRPSAEFSGKMHKFLISLADFLSALTFLCCHYIFDYICCHYSFNTAVYVYFHSH